MRVLLIDDDPAFLRHAEVVLRGLSVSVVCHLGPIGSLAAAKQHDPDVILLDLNMPSLDGRWLFSELQRVCKKARICFCSNAEPGRLDRLARAAGAHGMITKSQFNEPGVVALRGILMGIGRDER